jgi:hypothetical protein
MPHAKITKRKTGKYVCSEHNKRRNPEQLIETDPRTYKCKEGHECCMTISDGYIEKWKCSKCGTINYPKFMKVATCQKCKTPRHGRESEFEMDAIVIRNVPESTTEQKLMDHFSKYGEVKHAVQLTRHGRRYMPRTGMVIFKSVVGSDAALLDSHKFDDVAVSVHRAQQGQKQVALDTLDRRAQHQAIFNAGSKRKREVTKTVDKEPATKKHKSNKNGKENAVNGKKKCNK